MEHVVQFGINIDDTAIADTIQACCNLASALGVEDLTPHLAACEEKNRRRGRYGD